MAGRAARQGAVVQALAMLALAGSLPVAAEELDGRVQLRFGGFRYSRTEQVHVTTGTLTNVSADLLLPPVSVAVTEISPDGVELTNASGIAADGAPFVDVTVPAGGLGPGGTAGGIVLKFRNPGATGIRFSTAASGVLGTLDVVLSGHRELVGVAVAADGTVYASDAGAGEIYWRSPSGSVSAIVRGLSEPAGLALDAQGRLLIAEAGAGRLLRLEPSGALGIVASGLERPRWLAPGPDGSLYIAAHALLGPGGPSADEADVIVRRDPHTGSLAVVAAGLPTLAGLALAPDALVAAARRIGALPLATGVIGRYPLLPGGALGAPTYLVASALEEPEAVAFDRFGRLYFSAKALELGATRFLGAIGKAEIDGDLDVFASPLLDPRGLALGPDGALYVADGRGGRVVRYGAPAAPSLTVPSLTSEPVVPLTGLTEPGARVDAWLEGAASSVASLADSLGAFSVPLALPADGPARVAVYATAQAGRGLTGPASIATVTRDSVPPSVAVLAPAVDGHVRGLVDVGARASDGGGGVAGLWLSADAGALPGSLAPAPPAPSLSATATWDTTAVEDGSHELRARAIDRAGNVAEARRVLTVDNTPPLVGITGGPEGTVEEPRATFTFTGSDGVAPSDSLRFSWRLDEGTWSDFGPATSASLEGLGAGPHLFAVRARDAAGNESVPASRAFAVGGLRVVIVEPVAGATVVAGPVLVRGTVSGAAELGVAVNGTPAVVDARGAFAALVPASTATREIVAAVTTPGRLTASAAVAVTVVSEGAGPMSAALVASPSSGPAPLTTTFSLLGLERGRQVDLDVDGDGGTDAVGLDLRQAMHTFTQPGIYVARAVVTDALGRAEILRTIVQVFERGAVDALLRSRWSAMKDALRAGDVARAVVAITARARPGYERAFTAIAPRLPAIDQVLTDLDLVEMGGASALYEATRVDGGLARVFDVRFVVDGDGIWRLQSF